ncbi:hypothetical protein M8J77_007729 [Diaphorina citri]|nr:hypothetical protein M8J77_007729 [Diaphorina citri]
MSRPDESGYKYVCCRCTKFHTRNGGNLKQHLKKHKKPSYEIVSLPIDAICVHCKNFESTNVDDILDHCKTCTEMSRPDKDQYKYVCFVCTTFHTFHMGNFKQHLKKHSGLKPFSCAICDFQCGRLAELSKHSYLKHDIKCLHCKSFRSSDFSAILEHCLCCTAMPRLHGPKSKYVCWACTSFNTNHLGNVRKHIQRHLGDKPLRCAYCDYRCIQKSQLVIHAYNFHTASLDSLKGSSHIA